MPYFFPLFFFLSFAAACTEYMLSRSALVRFGFFFLYCSLHRRIVDPPSLARRSRRMPVFPVRSSFHRIGSGARLPASSILKERNQSQKSEKALHSKAFSLRLNYYSIELPNRHQSRGQRLPLPARPISFISPSLPKTNFIVMDGYLITEYPMIIHYIWLQKPKVWQNRYTPSRKSETDGLCNNRVGYAVTEPDSQVSKSLFVI